MNYSTEDAVALHHAITRNLETHGPEHVFASLTEKDPELLALALTLHGLKSVPHAAV